MWPECHDLSVTAPGAGLTSWRVGVSRCALGAATWIWLGLVAGLIGPGPAWALQEAAVVNAAATKTEATLRVTWGGGPERTWLVQIAVVEGNVLTCENLGLALDTPGSAEVRAGRMQLRQRSATSFGGVDVRLSGATSARVNLSVLAAEDPTIHFQREFPLGELLGESQTLALDEDGNRLTIGRKPGDWLQVGIGRPHLVFSPGETWRVTLESRHALALAGREAVLRATLVPARQSRPALARQTWTMTLDSAGNAPAVEWEIEIPGGEGAYDLELVLEPYWNQAAFTQRRLVRRVQFAVVDPAPLPMDEEPPAWRTLGEYRLDGTRKSSGFPDPVTALRDLAGGVNARGADPSTSEWQELAAGDWRLVELPVSEPGKLHRVTIEYRTGPALAAGFSLLQPDATGNIPSAGFDSGVALSPGDKLGIPDDEAGAALPHEIHCWPSARKMVLLVANRHASAGLGMGTIRVETGPGRLAAGPSQPVARRDGEQPAPTRAMLCFAELPLFADQFGATRAVDPESGLPVDDWWTFIEGADRWVQQLQHAGYSGAMLCVAAEGGAIAPLESLGATPRYDSGIFGGLAADPVRKDVLELLLRMFDRAGLTLVPVLEFKSPLPAIEQQSRSNPVTALSPASGEAGLASADHYRDSYDPLTLPVQQAIEAVVDELVARYSGHASLSAIAITVRPDTWLRQPEPENGASLWPEFVGASGLSGYGTDPDSFRAALGDPELRLRWQAWQAGRLNGLFEQLNRVVANRMPRGKLIVAQADTFSSGWLAEALNPSLQREADLVATAELAGWNAPLWANESTLLLQPHRTAPHRSTVTERTSLHGNAAAPALFQQVACPAVLFAQRVDPAHFSAVESRNPFGTQTTALVRVQPMASAGSLNRRRFIDRLHAGDVRLFADGGWMPVVGAEPYLQELFAAFRSLPDVGFTTLQPLDSSLLDGPVCVRQAGVNGVWHGYLLNASPRAVVVQLSGTGNNATQLEVTGGAEILVQPLAQPLKLGPWSLLALRATGGNPELNDYLVTFDSPVREVLREQVFRLQSALPAARVPIDLGVVRNAGFEQPDPGGTPVTPMGWRWNEPAGDSVTVRDDAASPGNHCLRLASGGDTVWIRSNEFDAPATGRLSVTVNLRTDPARTDAPLRISVESTNGNDYYRFGPVGGLAEAGAEQLAVTWKPFVVHFDDLPVEEGTRLRIGFDLMGGGEVFVDDIRVHDRLLDDRDLRAVTQLLASASNALDDPQKADQCRRILESYWPMVLDEVFATPVAAPTTGPVAAEPVLEPELEPGLHMEEPVVPADSARAPWRLRRTRRN